MLQRGEEQISPAEFERHQWADEELTKRMAHNERLKQLEIEADKLEAKITSWFHIPVTIIKLPFLILMVIPLTVYAVTHQEIPEFYRKLMR